MVTIFRCSYDYNGDYTDNNVIFSGLIDPVDMYVSNRTAPKLEAFKQLGMQTTLDNMFIFNNCDVIVLAIKPQVLPTIVEEFKDKISSSWDITTKIFVSVMGPVPMQTISNVSVCFLSQ